MNPLLREGKLKEGLFTHASPQTNALFAQKNAETIDHIAKELLFLSMAATCSLNSLPSKYHVDSKVIRVAHIPKAIFETMKPNRIVTERGFTSASAPGGGFGGGGPCGVGSSQVKYVIHSKTGKSVNEFSDLPENEVLFAPFTKFRVINVTNSRVEMEEILDNDLEV
jgi:hypothetical protein